MAANLTFLDTELISDVIFRFQTPGLAAGNKFKSGGFRLKFQFPPRFISDNRKGDWVEGSLRGDEPVAVYGTSGAREISMKWTYIAGARGGSDKDGSNILFTPSLIAEQVRSLRSYFSSPHNKEITIDKALIIKFRCWRHTGRKAFTCRMKSIDITHGNTLVSEHEILSARGLAEGESPGDLKALPRRTYALRTDVTAEMRLWTRVAAGQLDDSANDEGGDKGKKAAKGAAGGAAAKLELVNLENRVSTDWQ